MPELPEVEVTKRIIEPLLVNRKIKSLEVTPPSHFFLTPPAILQQALPNRTVTQIKRRGKYLLCTLDDGSTLLMHLGMTGQLFGESSQSIRLLSSTARAALAPEDQLIFKPDKHTHLIFSFMDGRQKVFFRDVRKFGKVELLAPNQESPRVSKLGPDALVITRKQLWPLLQKRKSPIKTAILDQSLLAGAGNIYADEALFSARVHPQRKANTLTADETERILLHLKRVLRRSIETGGSSISDYVRPDGKDGKFQDERQIYARTGKPCYKCGQSIQRVVVGGRSSHFCAKCQPKI